MGNRKNWEIVNRSYLLWTRCWGHYIFLPLDKLPISELARLWEPFSHSVKKAAWKSFRYDSVERNPTSIREDVGSIPGLVQWVKDERLLWAVVSVADVAQIWCGRGCGHTIAPIWPFAWEFPYAVGVALNRQKRKEKKAAWKEMAVISFSAKTLLRSKNLFSSVLRGWCFDGEDVRDQEWSLLRTWCMAHAG